MGFFDVFKKKDTEIKDMISLKDIVSKSDKFNAIRMIYIAYSKYNDYSSNEKKLEQTYCVSSPLLIPQGINIEEACKIASYLSEKVERENNLEPACEQSVALTSQILQEYGFMKLKGYNHGHYHVKGKFPRRKTGTALLSSEKINGVVDLITIDGDPIIFKQSEIYNRYFDWFTANVSETEIKYIYEKAGINLDEMLQKTREFLKESDLSEPIFKYERNPRKNGIQEYLDEADESLDH